MSSVLVLVADVESLIARYGYDAIRDTLTYLHTVELKNEMVNVYEPISSSVWSITRDQYNDILYALKAESKIQAIKKFRDITSSSLLDAKRAVENLTY